MIDLNICFRSLLVEIHSLYFSFSSQLISIFFQDMLILCCIHYSSALLFPRPLAATQRPCLKVGKLFFLQLLHPIYSKCFSCDCGQAVLFQQSKCFRLIRAGFCIHQTMTFVTWLWKSFSFENSPTQMVIIQAMLLLVLWTNTPVSAKCSIKSVAVICGLDHIQQY